MQMRGQLDAFMNGLITIAYLWLGIAIYAAPQMVAAIQAMDDVRQNTVFIACLFFTTLCSVGLLTKIGILRPNNFTRDETIFPIAGVFALTLYLL
jgi:hypothetical protein